MEDAKVKVLRELLKPLVHEEASRIHSFLEDDMEGFISGVKAFQIEDKVIAYVRAHPNATAQDLYHLIPEGVPPGQEEILEDEDE